MTIGEKIKKVRNTFGTSGKKISQSEFAQAIEVNRSTLAQYETNSINPSTRILKKICEVYKVNMDWLINDDVPDSKMYIDTSETLTDMLKQDFKLDDTCISIVQSYMKMSKDEKKAIKKFVEEIAKGLD